MVLGGVIQVLTLDGSESLKIPTGTQPGSQFALKGKGANRFQRNGRGDMIVMVQVKVPDRLTNKQRDAIRNLGESEL